MKSLTLKLILLFLIINISNNNEITITIRGNGNQKIISYEFQDRLPDKIIINGDTKYFIDNTINLIQDVNIITLIWSENHLTNCNNMFKDLINITEFNFSKFDSSKITKMSYMLSNCSSIESLDLSIFDTSKVQNMDFMFKACTNLKELNLSNFNTSSLLYISVIFGNCSSLTILDISNFDISNIDNLYCMFCGCSNLKSINLSNFNTSKVITMDRVFSGCSKLTSLDLSNFDTSNVLTMTNMFYECSSIQSINLANFDTSNVTDMDYMFSGCRKLESLDLSNFDTSNVQFMDSMFSECSLIKSINLASFNTSNVENMDKMFFGCINLESLDLSNFETLKVESMEYIFGDCKSLISLNLTNFNLFDVTNIDYMFYNCEKLMLLDIRYLDLLYDTEIDEGSIFIGTNKNLTVCIDNDETFFSHLLETFNKNCSCYLNPKHKIILQNYKCLYNCSQDDIYKYEYNNLCYESCPNHTKTFYENNSCIDILYENNFYKNEQTECISDIPEGYYLNDTNLYTIDKCSFECRNCSLESNENNSCISCNISNNYYPKYDDILENNSFIKCYNGFQEGYFLDNNIYMPCYFSCLNCSGNGSEHNHQCISCKYGYKFLDFRNDTNCYNICNNYYFFDLNNKYYCTEGNNCPDNYNKLIQNKRKCVNNCSSDDIYKYEYNNECFKGCPNSTVFSLEKKICIDELSETINYITNTKNYDLFKKEYKINDFFKNQCKQKYINDFYFDYECFNFIKFIDKVKILKNNNNFIINYYPDIVVNIYMNGINIDEIEEIYSNLTFIYLEECGDMLKKYYKLDSNENLYIANFETFNNIENRITNQTRFRIYIKNGTELEDLSICNNVSISISSLISKLDMANYDKAEIFHFQGYNIYNLSSEFYSDKCTGANINGNDVVLNDRKEHIYPNNASFCPNKCELNNVKIESKRVNCSCNISYFEEEIIINDNKTIFNDSDFFIYLLDKLNYKIFGCYTIIYKLQFKDLINNTGFYFGIGFLLFIIICYFVFSCYYLRRIKIQIYKLLPNKKDLLKKFYLLKKKIEKINQISSSKTNIIFNNKNSLKEIISIEKKKTKKRKGKRKRNYSFKYNKENLKNSEYNIININKEVEVANNFEETEEKDYNSLPYIQALKLDKRNIFLIYLSFIKIKIDIISILFYPEEFTHKSLTLSIYTFEFLFSFFLNALLYTDDIVSEKYHNNGQLDIFTTIFLSLTSNIISSIIMYFIQKIVSYREYLSRMVNDLKEKDEYILTFTKLYLLAKIKIFFSFLQILVGKNN